MLLFHRKFLSNMRATLHTARGTLINQFTFIWKNTNNRMRRGKVRWHLTRQLCINIYIYVHGLVLCFVVSNQPDLAAMLYSPSIWQRLDTRDVRDSLVGVWLMTDGLREIRH